MVHMGVLPENVKVEVYYTEGPEHPYEKASPKDLSPQKSMQVM